MYVCPCMHVSTVCMYVMYVCLYVRTYVCTYVCMGPLKCTGNTTLVLILINHGMKDRLNGYAFWTDENRNSFVYWGMSIMAHPNCGGCMSINSLFKLMRGLLVIFKWLKMAHIPGIDLKTISLCIITLCDTPSLMHL